MSPWRPDSQCGSGSGSGVRAVISECQLCQPCSSHRLPLGWRQQAWGGLGERLGGAQGPHRQGAIQAQPQVLHLCLPQWLLNSPSSCCLPSLPNP